MADLFWNLSDGEDISKTGASFESGGGDMEPIPNKTQCVAFIEEAKIDTNNDGLRFISIRWSVLAPSEYKNRKVFQKVWCLDDDPRARDPNKKRDTAKKMLFAIDQNAGGHMIASGKPPSDGLLSKAFLNKQMQIKVMTYELDGEKGKITGNWISAVSPKNGGSATVKPMGTKAPVISDDDEDAPF